MNWFAPKRIYMDYASAPRVLEVANIAMRDAERFIGNPGAIHAEAVEAKQCLEHSREMIAQELSVKPREILFTSGLTESNNLAITGYARHLSQLLGTLAGTEWIVSAIEHTSVLACFHEVEVLGGRVVHIEPDAHGLITPQAVQHVLHKETIFVSVGWGNNEIGIIQPLREISSILRAHEKVHGREIMLHTDVGQAPLYLGTTMHSLGVDLASFGANKLYGPHGIGALYLSNRVALAPMIHGGKQERGLRAGTENVALAAGFAAAFTAIANDREAESKRLKALRDDLAEKLRTIPGLVVNGDLKCALPHMLNVSIPDISSEYVTLALDSKGIAISTKSACHEGDESRSHVVSALGGEPWISQNTLRFSLGRATRISDIARVVHALEGILSRQRG